MCFPTSIYSSWPICLSIRLPISILFFCFACTFHTVFFVALFLYVWNHLDMLHQSKILMLNQTYILAFVYSSVLCVCIRAHLSRANFFVYCCDVHAHAHVYVCPVYQQLIVENKQMKLLFFFVGCARDSVTQRKANRKQKFMLNTQTKKNQQQHTNGVYHELSISSCSPFALP